MNMKEFKPLRSSGSGTNSARKSTNFNSQLNHQEMSRNSRPIIANSYLNAEHLIGLLNSNSSKQLNSFRNNTMNFSNNNNLNKYSF